MKRWVLAVLLAGTLLLQGNERAAAEELAWEESDREWMTESAADPVREEALVIFAEDNLSGGDASETGDADGMDLSEEEAPVLTIEAVEETDLLPLDAYMPSPAAEADKVKINAENFPDETFRTYVKGLDQDKDQALSASEITSVTSISVKGNRVGGIRDLTGIEYFTSLQTLNCSTNQLKQLDVSKNTALTELNCSSNQLTDLDVSRNPALMVLNCGNNELTSLDVSKNPKLTTLECYYNQLTSLNVSKNPALVTLFCHENQLTGLDVSACADIVTLSCGSNRLTSLKLGTAASLADLNCENNELTSLDVSSYSGLRLVDCSKNRLTSFKIGTHIRLNTIECQENELTSLDVSRDSALQNLICSTNQLTVLDLSKNQTIAWLDCSDNRLSTLNLCSTVYEKTGPSIKQIFCENNQLTALNLPADSCRALEILNCTGNKIESLDVSGCPGMTGLDCENTRLKSLDVSGNSALQYLFCGFNPLMSLDLSKNSSLIDLKCESSENTIPGCSYNSDEGLDLAGLIKEENLPRVEFLTGGVRLENGKIKFSGSALEQISYQYDTKAASSSPGVSKTITVTLKLPAHMYKEIVDKEATCTEPGSRHRECEVCGYVEPREEIPAAGHVFGPMIVDREATCTEPGSQHHKCTVCGFEEAGPEIPAAGHVFGPMILDREATCTEPGSQHRECTVCGFEEAGPEIPATGLHSYGEYVTVKEPTALEEGLETRTCSVCGETQSRTTDRLEATIELSAGSILLQKKQSTDKLTVSGLAKGDSVISWKSGNTKLVAVKSTGNRKTCTLTAKNRTGSTKVTVRLASGLKKKIQVTVQEDEVATRKISGLEKSMTLSKGEKITLKPVITPLTSTQEVTYQTSDKKIAAVSAKGVVKAVSAGRAKITVNSGNKSFVITMNIKKSKK